MPNWMIELSRFSLALIPLFLIPLVIGSRLSQEKIGWPSRWWLGAILTGLGILLGHALGFPEIIVYAVLTAAFLFCLLPLLRRALGIFQPREKPVAISIDFAKLVPTIFIGILLAANYLFILSHPLDPRYQDAVGIWYHKAKELFYWTPFAVLPVPNFAMNNYPHLGPVLEMFIMKFTGAPLEAYGRLIFPTFYFLWILAFNDLYPPKSRGIFRWVLPWMALVFFDQTTFTNGYQDGFLATCAGMATFYFLKILLRLETSTTPLARTAPEPNGMPEKDLIPRTDCCLAFFFLGTLGFIKVEGTALAIIILIAWLATLIGFKKSWFFGKGYKILLPYLGLLLVMFSLWPLLLKFNGISPTKVTGSAYTFEDLFTWYRNTGRLPMIGVYLQAYFQNQIGIIMGSLGLSLLAGFLLPRIRMLLGFLWLALLGHCLFVLLAFLATHLPLQWHLDSAFMRLMFQHFFIFTSILILCVVYLAREL